MIGNGHAGFGRGTLEKDRKAPRSRPTSALQDAEWGPAFIKVGTYVPYPVRVCLNGNEWLKQQLRKEAIPFDSLDNGFLWCADLERLQQLADSLSPADVEAFFDRWLDHLPWPLTPADRAAGYRHRLSIWQLEMSLTQIFTTPVYGRHFFEAVIRDNLDLGRPDRVSLLFPTRVRRNTPPPNLGYKTRVITCGVAPSLHVEFKHSHVKQYFKEERALRTETTINDPLDFQRTKGLETLPHLRSIGRQINTKLLEIERVADGLTPGPSLFDRLQSPTLSPTGQRVSALRFGDQRVHAPFAALCRFSHLPDGFRHRDLRPLVAALLGRELAHYSAGAMTYDLRRLRLHGIVRRAPARSATRSRQAAHARRSSTQRCRAVCDTYTTHARRSHPHPPSKRRSTNSTWLYRNSGVQLNGSPELDSSGSPPLP